MKKIITSLSLFVLVAIITTGTLVSCKSKTDAVATEDSLKAVVAAEEADALQKKQMDSSMRAEQLPGKAIPNPAKKKGKGVIVLQSDWQKNYDQEYANLVIEMDKEGIYNRAEIKPSYPGGEKALAKFIQENIVYPEDAIDNGVEATVDVVFAVDEAGRVYTPRIKGEREGYGLDQASLDVVSKMPKWNPGQIKGKNVKSYYSLPISFVINN